MRKVFVGAYRIRPTISIFQRIVGQNEKVEDFICDIFLQYISAFAI